ncbi:MAG: hypothetical protein QOG49_1230, partial [Frankiaceae bacterium]|nr:hypothetical protein [Frankiaceae bacterium]
HVHAAGVQSVSPLPAAPPQVQQVAAQPVQAAAPAAASPFAPIQVEPAQAQPIRLEPVHVEPVHVEPSSQVEQPRAEAVQPQAAPAQAGPPAGWHPDPSGQFEQRYWDGSQWTEHVAHQGQQGVSALGPPPQVQTSSADQVQRQVQRQAGLTPAAGGGGHLMDEPILVVNQKAKLIELVQEFAVYDQVGNRLGSVVEVGQSALKKLVRFGTNFDQFMTHKFEVRDAQGQLVMTLVRPAKLMKSKVVVGTPAGQEIGVIRQENVLGKIRFAFEAGGQRIGGIQAENWRAWNFSIVDGNGQEVARITKTWEGIMKAAFTTADNYVIQIHHRLPEPLRSLVVASALTVDTALKQDSR